MTTLQQRLLAQMPSGCRWASVRQVHERHTQLAVRRGVVVPPSIVERQGWMVQVHDDGGAAYAAVADLSDAGLRRALERAQALARAASRWRLFEPALSRPAGPVQASWRGPCLRPYADADVGDYIAELRRAETALAVSERIVDRGASLWCVELTTSFADSDGSAIDQQTSMVIPDLDAVAHAGGASARRSLGNRGLCLQGGVELLYQADLATHAARIGDEAAALLDAAPCPTETTDLVLAPDQMMLQIHESIGHPLELDRILGDERNYAGTSFVRPEMFGSYRYGSELLNVTFAPDVGGEFASYGYDDDGRPAERTVLIDRGILQRPLGSHLSGRRAGLAAVANARACNWNRPPIDRMANLNVEPGDSSLDDLIAGVERGVYMQTNCSWSIDDSRNKFQFGCEIAWEIRDGSLGRMLRDPNYRGISAEFWRSLDGVGDPASVGHWGSPFCGKGEPNQVIRVGHASPPCRFRGVEVFGAAV